LFESIFDPTSIPFWLLIIAILIGVILVISRSFSTYVKFVYPNAKFEAIGNPYVKEREITRVIDSKNLSGFKDVLNSSKDYNITGDNTFEVQKSLDDNFVQTVEMMRNDSSKKLKDFFSLNLEKQDLYLIKNAIKKKRDGKTIDENYIELALLPDTKKLLYSVKDAEPDKLPELLTDFGEETTKQLQEEEFDIQLFDTTMDKHIINRFRLVKMPYKCEPARKKFVNTMIDILNIKNVLRAKQLGFNSETCKKLYLGEGQEIALWKYNELSEVDQVSQVISGLEGTSYYNVLKDQIENYNKENSVQILTNALDGVFLKLVKDISLQNYINIGPTLRFLVSKEFEIKNLKIIAKGISENLSEDDIKSSLVLEVN